MQHDTSPRLDIKVALLSRAILPRQISVEDLGEILELKKNGAGDAESRYQFVDVREEEELGKAKLDGERNEAFGNHGKEDEWGVYTFVRKSACRGVSMLYTIGYSIL